MHNARTGEPGRVVAHESTSEYVEQACGAALDAFTWLSSRTRAERANLLDLLATGLEENADELIKVADEETALGTTRLGGELIRTAYQLRFMGDVARDGGYLDVSIEHPAMSPMGPIPDIRRTSVPVGPVAVFGSSNFPFAFSAPGGDTASAIAAGCPVIVKAHSAHPGLSALTAKVFGAVLRDNGMPAGVFSVVHGRSAGTQLVADPRIAAVGFTGSVAGGRFLFDIASRRPAPIPFYGELGSVNPFVVSEQAAIERSSEIAAGLAASMTQGLGQFCTKPGVFLIPEGEHGDHLVSELVRHLERVPDGYLLSESISDSFRAGVREVVETSGVEVLMTRECGGRTVSPVLVRIDAHELAGEDRLTLTEERFGPFGVVTRYESFAQIMKTLDSLPPALTGTVHVGSNRDDDGAAIASALEKRSGRLIVNGYPTGVAVSWSMNHGGQYPSSTTWATSVGAGSIRRWVRPLTFQDVPEYMLPSELRDSESSIPRRINGKLVAAS